jgi:predicted nucleic acid-binding Zn ribbon protein
MPMKKSYCKVCKEPLEGRIDKKFCSDACRCAYFNKSKLRERNEIRKIDRILKKNRKILKMLFDAGRLQASHQELEIMGFEFGYATQVLVANETEIRYYCYDLGLSSSKSQPQFSLVRKRIELNEQLTLNPYAKGQGRSL